MAAKKRSATARRRSSPPNQKKQGKQYQSPEKAWRQVRRSPRFALISTSADISTLEHQKKEEPHLYQDCPAFTPSKRKRTEDTNTAPTKPNQKRSQQFRDEESQATEHPSKRRKGSQAIVTWLKDVSVGISNHKTSNDKLLDEQRSQTHMDSQSNTSCGGNSSINAYRDHFETELRRRRVYFIDEEEAGVPDNIGDIKKALLTLRESPEPSEQDAKLFRKRVRKSTNEAATMQSMLPKIINLDRLWDHDELLTVPNQQWDKRVIQQDSTMVRLVTPKPDQTIGFTASSFKCDTALASLGAYACPVSSASQIAFPCFTVEAKGDAGNLKTSRLQNLLNGYAMLNNILKLRQSVGTEESFLGQAQVFSLALTTESIELSYYWVSRDFDGQINFNGQVFNSWNPNSKSDHEFKEACRCTRNALDLVASNTRESVQTDLQRLKEKMDIFSEIVVNPVYQVTPPQSRTDLSERRKSRVNQLDGRKRTRQTGVDSRSSSRQRFDESNS